MNGWLRLHRQLLRWEWYSCVNTTRVFIHLLLTASWRDARWQGIEIPRGSVFASPETLATATGLTRQQVRTVIARLKSTSEITTKATNKGTLITLCNFDAYNPSDFEINQQENQHENNTPTSDQPAINQRLTTSEEGKKGKKGKSEEVKNLGGKARPSSREEFDAFFREIGLFPRDAEAAWNKWEGNGWTTGGRKIKCWRSTVRSWKAEGYHPSQKSPSEYEQQWPKVNGSHHSAPAEDEDLWEKVKAKRAAEQAAEDARCTPVESTVGDPAEIF